MTVQLQPSLKLSLLSLVLLCYSCSDDICSETVCSNNGTVVQSDGQCSCDCSETLYTGEQCDISDPSKVQGLLDAGSTPLDLLNDGVPVDSFYGKEYQGGLIFYIDTDTGTGLVAAKEDQGLNIMWGCQSSVIDGADGEAVGSGQQNTLDIIAGCNETEIAAKLCQDFILDSYEDWFLPSKDELTLMYSNLHQNNHGDFIMTQYWSSTEAPGFGLAWVRDFGLGIEFMNSKDASLFSFVGVRAVRVF